MKIIKHSDIAELKISPVQFMKWVREALMIQYESIVPPKISVHLPDDGFFNTMPCYIPQEGVMGVKVVNRFLNNSPALDATMILYDAVSGELQAMMDATLITTMRTGAVAATSIIELKSDKKETQISFMGLGVTARATALCLLESVPGEIFNFKLLRYKDQAEQFIERFCNYSNARFEIVDSCKELFSQADVIVSCITSAQKVYGQNEWFKEGVVVVPVHTRGFQNCDLFFDKVFGDVTGQISGFKYFDQFKKFDELAKVIQGLIPGRENDKERILVYNIGMALHDIYIGSQVHKLLMDKTVCKVTMKEHLPKFYI